MGREGEMGKGETRRKGGRYGEEREERRER